LRKVLERKLLATSWRVKFYEDTVKDDRVGELQKYARLVVPDFVLAVAKDSDGKIPLVSQYRHGAGKTFWEFPAGLTELGENPVDCVKREFREEVGQELDRVQLAFSVFTSPTRTRQRAHIFFGRVGKKSTQNLDAGEELSVRFVSDALAWNLLRKNNWISEAHLLAYLLARQTNFLSR
jgi:ADP-ribose pyrophosphatase